MRDAYWALAGALAAFSAVAQAQTAPAGRAADVVRQADDAFGVRIGVEQFGLYSERFVRGFSLEAAANYRIDGAYYVPAATPVNPLLTATTIRVGPNALPFDFPAPSGVVDYGLRGPAPTGGLTLRGGIDRYESPFLEVDFSLGEPALGLAGGVQIYPVSTYADGSDGAFYSLGLSPEWRPSSATRLRGLLGLSLFTYDGDQGFVAAGAELPPPLSRLKQLGKASLRAALFHSRRETPDADFTLVSGIDRFGRGTAALFTAPDQRRATTSGELSLTRRFSTGPWAHRAMATLRGRISDARTPVGRTIALGPIDLGGPRTPAPPIDRSPTGQESVDRVEQGALGLSYRVARGETLELRAGVQRNRYERRFERSGAPTSQTSDLDWLGNASALWRAHPRMTLFASYTRGLEDSGIAPARASNRNEALPPVLAAQAELGGRVQVSDTVSLTASAFRTEKPVPAFDADGAFRLAGDAVYQGVEASLNARFDNGLSLVVGAVGLDMSRTDGLGGPALEPVGVAARQGLVGVSYAPPALARLTLDTQITLQGPRWADTANTIKTEGFVGVDVGLRYQFIEGGPTVRLQVINAGDLQQWVAQPAQILGFIVPRTYRLTLTQSF
jgi:iron complex outermembrane receptor protein